MNSLYPNLRRCLSERNISVENLAALTKLDVETVSLKLKGVLDWSLWEVVTLCCHLEEPDVNFLFLRLDSN